MGAIDPVVGVFRAEHAQVFAALWRRLGEFDLVEAAMADAYLAAMAAWGSGGVPQNPTSWIATVAMSATTSVLSRRDTPVADAGSPSDDLRAVFATCCQPALAPDERVVCVARAVVGMMPGEIAALLGVSDPVIHTRLTQAKRVLRQAGRGLAPIPDEPAAHAERIELIRAAAAVFATAPGREAVEISALVDARLVTALL